MRSSIVKKSFLGVFLALTLNAQVVSASNNNNLVDDFTAYHNAFLKLKQLNSKLDLIDYSYSYPNLDTSKLSLDSIPISLTDTTLRLNSQLSYLFKKYKKDNSSKLTLPFALFYDEHQNSYAIDKIVVDGSSYRGMSSTERSLKEQSTNNYGLMLLSYKNKNLINFKEEHLHALPQENIRTQSFSNKILKTLPGLLGMRSNLVEQRFIAPLSSFDKNLYHEVKKSYLADDNLFSIDDSCNSTILKNNCPLYFLGKNTSSLFFNQRENKTSLAKLKLSYDKNLKPHFNFKNTILDDGEFVNYGFYTEAELSLFKDLGYDINLRDFYGSSIYTSGTKDEPYYYEVKTPFATWSEELNSYKTSSASRVPMSIGTHIMGDYNTVVQQANINATGYGSIGVRIDGSNNSFELQRRQSIEELGHESLGIAVAYGSNNLITVNGNIEANRNSGSAIKLSFGTNAKSDLIEYRGSYHKVRSLDFYEDRLSKSNAQHIEIDEDLNGPLVKELNIRGHISGKNSILIDSNAYVQKINLLNRARLDGDIISLWQPYYGNSGIYIKSKDEALLTARLQNTEHNLTKKEANEILNKLRTDINVGIRAETKKENTDLKYVADKRSNVVVNGDIKGNSIYLTSRAGHLHINGSLNIKSLAIANSDLILDQKNKSSHIDVLRMRNGSRLALSNGMPDEFHVDKLAYFSNNSVISVDTDKDANIIDKFIIKGEIKAQDGLINLEPAFSYNDMKSFNSDPKALRDLVNSFVYSANTNLVKYGVTTRYPKHIWYTQSEMGREVKCTARGCYLGEFVSNYAQVRKELPRWRYLLSIIGCIVLVLGSYFIFGRKGAQGRYG